MSRFVYGIVVVGLPMSGVAPAQEPAERTQKFQGKVRWSFNAGETVSGPVAFRALAKEG